MLEFDEVKVKIGLEAKTHHDIPWSKEYIDHTSELLKVILR